MIVTANFGIVTGDFGLHLKIGHDQLKSAVMIVRKNRSRSIEMSGHDGPKYAIYVVFFSQASNPAEPEYPDVLMAL